MSRQPAGRADLTSWLTGGAESSTEDEIAATVTRDQRDRHKRRDNRAGLRKTLTAFGLLELFVIEAIARRNLVRFLITLGVVFAVISTVAGVTVFFGWQVSVAGYFGALALLITNQPELVRDWRRRIRDGARPKSGQP